MFGILVRDQNELKKRRKSETNADSEYFQDTTKPNKEKPKVQNKNQPLGTKVAEKFRRRVYKCCGDAPILIGVLHIVLLSWAFEWLYDNYVDTGKFEQYVSLSCKIDRKELGCVVDFAAKTISKSCAVHHGNAEYHFCGTSCSTHNDILNVVWPNKSRKILKFITGAWGMQSPTAWSIGVKRSNRTLIKEDFSGDHVYIMRHNEGPCMMSNMLTQSIVSACSQMEFYVRCPNRVYPSRTTHWCWMLYDTQKRVINIFCVACVSP